ncbi:FGGY-family carbohydrate kinase [Celeribacter indicus]|uniref:Carbohydrate kinase n=1 Tax=Celeribacter indicus TaxID=1208324 RepID=A0A0B5E062_9RHOB|nr:FGGY-family carbohydrate kinase [Celeribacter indicus]AJE46381.1 carbohydrate kinase [Celeribacter indicus]SDW55122.1 Sugar (pentulose or hexulose) kinase [Celeribacter indicus]
MTVPRHIAVLDVGKTNAKLALVDGETLKEIAVVTRPNNVLQGPPWPHFDLDGHWAFFLEHLAAFQTSHGIDAISVTTHGAAAVLLDTEGALAAPMLDYEHDGPDRMATDYDAIRPPFSETGSARLAMGLNLGAQLHWQFRSDPALAARTAHVLTYPQYWGYKLTGVMATDVTSLGCHTDLWNPWKGGFSMLVERLGLSGRLAPAHRSGDVLGTVTEDIAARTGLSTETPVVCGIHDSNASLLPHVLGRTGAFSVVSTGTWVVAMSVRGEATALDPDRDTLVNVNALGQAVPSARFMGGREYEIVRAGGEVAVREADRAEILDKSIMLLPAVEPGSGPFQGREARWTGEPGTHGARMAALGFYLALMTRTCLDLVGAKGPVIVEGPFARNSEYLDMLASLHEDGVEIAESATGTSVGAAMLFARQASPPATRRVTPRQRARLADYAAHWRAAVEGETTCA